MGVIVSGSASGETIAAERVGEPGPERSMAVEPGGWMTPGGEKAGPGAFVGEAKELLVGELRPPMWSMTEETVAPMLSVRCTATVKDMLG